MNPQFDQERLTAYALGETEAEENQAIERFLEEDEEALAWVEAVRDTALFLEDGLGEEETPALRPSQRDKITGAGSAAVKDDTRQGGEVVRPMRWQWWAVGGGIAAAAALALVSVGTATLGSYDDMDSPAGEQVVAANQEEAVSAAAPATPPDDPSSTDGPVGRNGLDGQTTIVTADVSKATATKTGKTRTPAAGSDPGNRQKNTAISSTLTQPGITVPTTTEAPAGPAPARRAGNDRWRTSVGGEGARDSDRVKVKARGYEDTTTATTTNERYGRLVDNPFLSVASRPLSTFSIDVDTASYANVRRFIRQGQPIPADSVRIEEMINYFDYDYPQPRDDKPFAVHMELANSPWTQGNKLVKIGLKGAEIDRDQRPDTNLVFLIDVSGSMSAANKLPLLQKSIKMLVQQLGPRDRVALAVYAGNSGLVLDATPGNAKARINTAVDRLRAGGSTNGGAGIELAYDVASKNFIEGGANRVIIATDGDFNVGVSNRDDLKKLIAKKAKSGVYLSVLGFGMYNLNDATLETLAHHGNGNYAYIDTEAEARKVLVEQMSGTLVTIAKDVKIQVEFNPARVSSYRLVGYANRLMADEDFANDDKDAGDIGAGHTVTAMYELVPARTAPVNLKYRPAAPPIEDANSDEWLTVKLRFKAPDGDVSELVEYPLSAEGRDLDQASTELRFATAVATFGMLLRESPHAGRMTYGDVIELGDVGRRHRDPHGYRAEFLQMVRKVQRQP